MYSLEDIIFKLIENGYEDNDIIISITNIFGHINIKISCKGKEFILDELKNEYLNLDLNDEEKTVISSL